MSAGAAFRCAVVVGLGLILPTTSMPVKDEPAHALQGQQPTGVRSHAVTEASAPAGVGTAKANQPAGVSFGSTNAKMTEKGAPVLNHRTTTSMNPMALAPERVPTNHLPEAATNSTDTNPPASISNTNADIIESVTGSRTVKPADRSGASTHHDEVIHVMKMAEVTRNMTRARKAVMMMGANADLNQASIAMLTAEFDTFLQTRHVDPGALQRAQRMALFTATLNAVPLALTRVSSGIAGFRQGDASGTLSGIFDIMSAAGGILGVAGGPFGGALGAGLLAIASIGSFFVDLFTDSSEPPEPETPPRVSELTTTQFRTLIRSEIQAGLTVASASEVLAALTAVQNQINGHLNNLDLIGRVYLHDVDLLTAQLQAETREMTSSAGICGQLQRGRTALQTSIQQIAELMIKEPYAQATCDEYSSFPGDSRGPTSRDGPAGQESYELLNQLITRFDLVLNQVLIVISQTDALTRYALPSLPAGFLVQTIDNSCSLTGTNGMLTLNLQLLSQRNVLLHHCTMFQMSLAGGLRSQLRQTDVTIFGIARSELGAENYGNLHNAGVGVQLVTNMSAPFGRFWQYSLGYTHSFDNGFHRYSELGQAPPCPLYYGRADTIFSPYHLATSGQGQYPWIDQRVHQGGFSTNTHAHGTRPDIPRSLLFTGLDNCPVPGTLPLRFPSPPGQASHRGNLIDVRIPDEANCACGWGPAQCPAESCPRSPDYDPEVVANTFCAQTGILAQDGGTRQGDFRIVAGDQAERFCISAYRFPCARCKYCANSKCRGALGSLAAAIYPPFAPPPPITPLSPISPFAPPTPSPPPPPMAPTPYWATKLDNEASERLQREIDTLASTQGEIKEMLTEILSREQAADGWHLRLAAAAGVIPSPPSPPPPSPPSPPGPPPFLTENLHQPCAASCPEEGRCPSFCGTHGACCSADSPLWACAIRGSPQGCENERCCVQIPPTVEVPLARALVHMSTTYSAPSTVPTEEATTYEAGNCVAPDNADLADGSALAPGDTCCATGSGDNVWWVADLASDFTVTDLLLTGPDVKSSIQHHQHLSVKVWPKAAGMPTTIDAPGGTSCTSVTLPALPHPEVRASCETPASGQYVMVYADEPSGSAAGAGASLMLCEVRIFRALAPYMLTASSRCVGPDIDLPTGGSVSDAVDACDALPECGGFQYDIDTFQLKRSIAQTEYSELRYRS